MNSKQTSSTQPFPTLHVYEYELCTLEKSLINSTFDLSRKIIWQIILNSASIDVSTTTTSKVRDDGSSTIKPPLRRLLKLGHRCGDYCNLGHRCGDYCNLGQRCGDYCNLGQRCGDYCNLGHCCGDYCNLGHSCGDCCNLGDTSESDKDTVLRDFPASAHLLKFSIIFL